MTDASRIPRLLRRLAALLVVLGPSAAHADARAVAGRVADQWRAAGGTTRVLPAKFLFDDDRQVVAIPATEGSAPCTYVALVAARGLSFRAKLGDASNDPLLPPEPGARANSAGGVAELRRCDPERPVKSVEVSTEGGRGAVEIVVAHGPPGLPALPAVLPERTGGPVAPPPPAGALSALAPQDKRIESAEQRARRDGAILEPRIALRAGDDGTGDAELDVGEGCHRFEVVGRELTRVDRNGRRLRLDVDAELRDGEHVLARDRTEAPDARLEACVGKRSRLTLVYAGAVPGTDVVLLRERWPMPARLPALWGASARSRMARVLFVRHAAVPADDPVFLAEGGSGATAVHVPVEVGGCYLAIAAVTHGRARTLQLRASVGARESVDERGAAEEAALAAFCVRAHEPARVEVLARPSGVAWGVAVYRVKSGIWEAGR